MPALPYPTYSLDKLYLFPLFQTREEYTRATGKEAPAFDPQRPPKYWFDPAAENSLKRNVVYSTVVSYAENGGLLLDENGKPQTEAMLLLKSEAASVNIPPLETNVPGASVPCVPVPLRPLDEQEELVLGFGGIVLVRNKAIAEDTAEGFTASDRALLQAIARRLNVPTEQKSV